MSEQFTLTAEQTHLREAVRKLLESRVTSERVRSVMLDGGFDEDLWSELAAMDLVGLLVPAEYGGSEASFLDLSIVIEESGRRLASVPLVSSAVLSSTLLLAAGSEEQKHELLPSLASGATRWALASNDLGDIRVTAIPEGEGWHLTGVIPHVIDGTSAHRILVPAQLDGELRIFAISADDPGLEVEVEPVLDLTRPQARLSLDAVRVENSGHLAGQDASAALERALLLGAAALACEQVGGADEVLRFATQYAKDRIQFGRAIGSFQAIKHMLAEALVLVESARSAAGHAARAVSEEDRTEAALATHLAKSLCSDSYEEVVGVGLQVLGGIGFTWEHDAHLYLKRAKASKLLLGTPQQHREALAPLIGLFPEPSGAR